MAGLYRYDDLVIDLAPLASSAGARLVIADVVGVDPGNRTIALSSGETTRFDLLSLAVGGTTDVTQLDALGDRLLPVRPVGAFADRWPTVIDAVARGAIGTIAIVGGGAAGVELALAVAVAAARAKPEARIALVTSADGLLPGHAPQVRERALEELAARNIAVVLAQAFGTDNGLSLSNGRFLPVDLVIAATGSRAPSWLAESGLACTAAGFVAVDADLRSISHPAVFAAGDIVERVDRPLERSGVHAVKAGPVLAANLRATVAGSPLRRYAPRKRTLYLLALGDRRAIGSWGRLSATGRWVWWVKDRIDRHFVGNYKGAASERRGQSPTRSEGGSIR